MLKLILQTIRRIEYHLQNESLSHKRMLSFKEACIYYDLKEDYLYKLTSENLIPHCKPMGKLIWFDREKVDAWISKGEKGGRYEK